MAGPWDRYAPSGTDDAKGPWSQYATGADQPKQPKTFAIDWSRPVESVRADVAKLPEADRKDALRQWADATVAKERSATGLASVPIAIDNTVRTLSRGTFVGPWLDELTAATSSAPYDETLEYQRARDRAVDKDYPVASTVGQVAGGLAGGVGAATAAAKNGPGVLSAAVGGPLAAWQPYQGIAPSIAQGATMGAIYGANAGAGNSEGDLEQNVEDAKKGAGIGLAFGAALPPIITGAVKGAGFVADAASPLTARIGAEVAVKGRDVGQRLGIIDRPIKPLSAAASGSSGLPAGNLSPALSGADAAAEQMIANQLARANVSPQQLASKLDDAADGARFHSNSRAPNALAPVDLDPSLQRLASSASRQQPEAANTAESFLFARQTGIQRPDAPGGAGIPTRPMFAAPKADDPPMGQFERVRDALKRAFVIKDDKFHGHGKNALRTDDDLINAARDEAKVNYGAAYKAADGVNLQPQITPLVERWAERMIDEPPAVANALRRSLGYIQRAVSDAGKKSHLERLDKIKQVIDDQIDTALTSLNGRQRYLGGQLTELKNDLVKALDGVPNVGSLYSKAREEFGSKAEAREAIRLGRELFKEDSDIAVDQIAKFATPGMLKLVRLGILDGFEKYGERLGRGRDVTAVFDSPRMQEILRVVIPKDGKEFANRPERFGQYLGSEKSMIATRNEVLGNSKTAQRIADDQAFGTLESLVSDFKQQPSASGLAMRALERTLDGLFGMRADTAAALSRKLFTANDAERRALIERLEQRLGPTRSAHLARIMQQYQTRIAQQAAGTTAGTLQQKRNKDRRDP